MKKVFIIGGAGFIGSHLAKHLNGKYEVWINDNFTTGRQKNLEGVEYIDSDIVTGIEECDFIFHLAASVGVRYVNRNPKGAIKNNLDLERQVFEINEIHKKPLFFASTSEVYGNSPDVPYREDHPLYIGEPTQGRWGYACSKLMGEFLALHSDFPSVVGRFFNVTGEGQVPDYGMVLPNFIERGLSGEDLEVYGDGSATRCFCYVGEVVDAMEKLITNENCYGQVFNIGNPNNKIDMKELANVVCHTTGQKSDVSFIPFDDVYKKNPTDIKYRIPDTNKIQSYIDWNPKVTTKQIIGKMVDHVHTDINNKQMSA